MDTDGARALGRALRNNENSGSFRVNAEHAGAVESAPEEREIDAGRAAEFSVYDRADCPANDARRLLESIRDEADCVS